MGLAPTGKRRLVTAHPLKRPYQPNRATAQPGGQPSFADARASGGVAPQTAVPGSGISRLGSIRLLGCLPLKNAAARSGGRRPRRLGGETAGRRGTSVPRPRPTYGPWLGARRPTDDDKDERSDQRGCLKEAASDPR